jgi:hypothetical protein
MRGPLFGVDFILLRVSETLIFRTDTDLFNITRFADAETLTTRSSPCEADLADHIHCSPTLRIVVFADRQDLRGVSVTLSNDPLAVARAKSIVHDLA